MSDVWLSYWLGMIHNHTTSELYSCIQLGLKKQKNIQRYFYPCAFKSVQLDGLYYNFYSKKKTYVTCVAGEIVAQGLATEPPREARAVKPRGKINLTCSQPSQDSTAKTLQHSPANIISPATQAITYTFLTTFFKKETHAQYQPIVFPEIVLFHTQTRNNIITF